MESSHSFSGTELSYVTRIFPAIYFITLSNYFLKSLKDQICVVLRNQSADSEDDTLKVNEEFLLQPHHA